MKRQQMCNNCSLLQEKACNIAASATKDKFKNTIML